MKTVIAVLIAAGIGFGLGYLTLARKHAGTATAVAVVESSWQAEKTALELALADARKQKVEVRSVTRTAVVTNRLSPDEIIEKLLKLNPETSDESRNRILRQIVHHLQLLTDHAEAALPAIQAFLKQNQDIDYSSDVLNAAGERVNRTGAGAFSSRGLASTDFLVPPSLRLGLVDVLDQIGGENAQAVLAEVLDITGRGVEVAYIARVLQEETPDKFKPNALKAAKDLLTNLPKIDQPNRIDENARAYLYQVLAMYNDTSFAQTAQGLLITESGRIDRQAMNYLSATLKDQSVPMLYAAYKSPTLTNQTDKGTLLNAVLNYAGPHPQANELLTELTAAESLPAGVRAFTIRGLAGVPGRDRPTDPALIQARIEFLRRLRDTSRDTQILTAIDETSAALQRLLTGATN